MEVHIANSVVHLQKLVRRHQQSNGKVTTFQTSTRTQSIKDYQLCNRWAENVILGGVNSCRRHELPHSDSRVTHEGYHLVPRGLGMGRKGSRNRSRWGQKARLYIDGFQLLLQLLFFCFQPLLFISQLIFLRLNM